MTRVAGLDVGYSATKKSTGVAVLNGWAVSVSHHVAGPSAWKPILAAGPLEVIAIDGPVMPTSSDPHLKRAVETLFCSGSFSNRCKPAFSHLEKRGRPLRIAGGEAAAGLVAAAPLAQAASMFPSVRQARIVEAFPNAFLGVCLDDCCYATMPRPLPKTKFDWLYGEWKVLGLISRLPLGPAKAVLAERFQTVRNKDERAALVCALTALLVARGDYTAVGDDRGGWFFLPPCTVWAPWAQAALRQGLERLHGDHPCLRIVHGPTPG